MWTEVFAFSGKKKKLAIIDPTIVRQLVETRLQAVDTAIVPAANVFLPGMAVPDGLTRWVKLLEVRHEPVRTARRTEEPAIDRIVITIGCHAARSQIQTNYQSLPSVMAAVLGAMTAAMSLEHTGTNHQVELTHAQGHDLGEVDAQRGIAAGTVTVNGTVCRTSGTSMTARVT